LRLRATRNARREGSKTGAVVIGGDFHGLGIVRSLGRRGLPVFIIDDERSISRFSRYASGAVHVKDLRDEDRAVAALMHFGRRFALDGWVLFPTRDETVAAISRHRDTLTSMFRVPTPDWPVIAPAWDKRETYRVAGELGIPIPRTWYPDGVADLASIDANPPFVVKPAISRNFVLATKAKAWRADDRLELEERFSRASDLVGQGEVMIQEVIPGDGRQQFAYCAFFKDGKAVGSMVAQRRRQHPPEFGRASTFVETVDIPELEELSTRFLRAIGYYGLVEVEFKLDPRDGRYKLLDVNPRTWSYHTLGQRAGVDFPYLLFADQLGEETGSYRAASGIRWIRLVTDLPTGVLEIAGRRISPWQYLATLFGSDVESVFSREDLLPSIIELALLPYLIVKRGY
jgi:predicted ATP-grasp superfamily ATP-dependent carboligase